MQTCIKPLRLQAAAAYFAGRGARRRLHAVAVRNEQPIGRAPDGRRAPVEDMGVDHRCADILVAQEFLPACALDADRS